MADTPDPLELLRLEEVDAWLQYRDALRSIHSASEGYRQAEPWAWARLKQRRRSIRDRRRRLLAA